MSEVAKAYEEEKDHSAGQSLKSRREALNERLLGWGKLFVGGLGLSLAGLGLAATGGMAGAVAGPVFLTGEIIEGVGTLGIVGNTLKRLRAKNR
ncbi:MAG: hypothetical protein ACREHC_00075 [Candidatus Levyibacteriota bacterium]